MTKPRRGRKSETDPDPDADDRAIRVEMVNLIGIWYHCGRAKCLRAKACRVSGTPCFKEQFHLIQDMVAEVAEDWCRLADIPCRIDHEFNG